MQKKILRECLTARRWTLKSMASEKLTTTTLSLPLGPPSRTFLSFACRFRRICRSNGQLWSTCQSLRGRWQRCWCESYPLPWVALFPLKILILVRRDVPVIEKPGQRGLLTKEKFKAWCNSVKLQQISPLKNSSISTFPENFSENLTIPNITCWTLP